MTLATQPVAIVITRGQVSKQRIHVPTESIKQLEQVEASFRHDAHNTQPASQGLNNPLAADSMNTKTAQSGGGWSIPDTNLPAYCKPE